LTKMECSNIIEIEGSIDRVFELGANIQDWPRILPHYRYVRVDEASALHKVAKMGATRDGFPVTWRARQELRPEERRILFQHTGGITRGMEVEWRLEPVDNRVRVTIYHALSYPVPILGPLFADYIVGRLFISNIAGKTLNCIKRIVEAEKSAASL
jgi:ribosome-associated toxin RatA of RatAB toxin-antitoxin module